MRCADLQAAKGVELGLGFNLSGIRGSELHDEIGYDKARAVGSTTASRTIVAAPRAA